MVRFQLAMVFLFFFLPLIYADNFNLSSKLFEPAVMEISVEIKATLKIENEIFPGFKELVGREYDYSVTKNMQGISISSDGYIMASSKLVNNAIIVNDTISSVASHIVADTGRIDHIKKYGKEADAEELEFYIQYFSRSYEGPAGLYEKLFADYLVGLISVKIEKNDIYVRLSDDSTPLQAQLIDSNDEISILKVDKVNMPIVELKDTALQNGDQVFVITAGEDTRQPDIVQINSNNEYDLANDGGSGNSQSAKIITDAGGGTVALKLGDAFVTEDEIKEVLEENNITEKPSATNIEFKEALENFNLGDTKAAKKKLESTLQLYPEHKQAKELLQQINNMQAKTESFVDTWIEKIRGIVRRIPFEWLVALAVLLMIVISGFVLKKLRRFR